MPWKLVVLTGLGLLMVCGAGPAFTQSTDDLSGLRKDVEALKQGQATIQKELQELKNLLQQRAAPPAPRAAAAPAVTELQDVVLSIDGAPVKGDKDAKVTLIEFSDYQCPFCGRHFRQTLPQLESEYIKTGKVKYVLRDFPIASLHPQAAKGHEAAHCAGEQGKYWEMHGRLFTNQRAMSPKDLADHAQAIGLESTKFQECLSSGRYAAQVRRDLEDGEKAGVRGTPTFFLGVTEPGDPTKVKAVKALKGAFPYQSFKDAIDSLLASGKQQGG